MILRRRIAKKHWRWAPTRPPSRHVVRHVISRGMCKSGITKAWLARHSARRKKRSFGTIRRWHLTRDMLEHCTERLSRKTRAENPAQQSRVTADLSNWHRPDM